jgi:glycerol-3-phosphate dehydrogenase (NAD(P)+)
MRILVAGAGAWGTALAHVAKQAGNDVSVWSRGADLVVDQDAVIMAVPAQAVRDVLGVLKVGKRPVIVAAKGLERTTGKLMADVVRDVARGAIPMALSGPSFAADVMQGLPTAVTLACADAGLAEKLSQALSVPTFRIYHTNDLLGVELGGALKNVLAIAGGISDGLQLGESARAALIARGFAELSRMAEKMGARPKTLMGLSGLGDLLLTASSPQSRNRSFGFAIGQGVPVAQALAQSKGVVEGAATAAVARKLASDHKVSMPIVDAVCRIIDEGENPRDVVQRLLLRPATLE